jgi:glycosyltransferase involved in cell wall biosynthesis
MKRWYDKYLTVFEKPFTEAPREVLDTVGSNLAKLQKEKPLVSVVVIAYNDDTRLLACLWSLSDMQCRYDVEILGVDNNSKDSTARVFESVGLPYYTEKKQSCGYARNRGLQEVKGRYYICIDSDTMYPPKYVEKMVDELQKEEVVAVSATWSYVPEKDFPRFWMRIYEFLRDIHLFILSFKRPELSVRGLVFAYVADLGRKVGYSVHIKRGEDGSMAYGLKKYGKISFLWGRDTRAVTCTATLKSDGPFYKALKVRVTRYLSRFKYYFVRSKGYNDSDPSNLIDS